MNKYCSKRGIGMEDIIKQIAQIDSAAVNTRKDSEQALKEKKQQYEKQISDYKEETLAKAKAHAEELYEQIVNAGETGHDLAEEKSKKLGLEAKNRYLKVETALIHEVFDELFGVEG